jgi:hypothetical protein
MDRSKGEDSRKNFVEETGCGKSAELSRGYSYKELLVSLSPIDLG